MSSRRETSGRDSIGVTAIRPDESPSGRFGGGACLRGYRVRRCFLSKILGCGRSPRYLSQLLNRSRSIARAFVNRALTVAAETPSIWAISRYFSSW